MKNRSSLILYTCLLLLMPFSACRIIGNTDEIITPEWSPEIAIPLVESDISIQLLLEQGVPDTLISSGPEEVITLTYQTELLTIDAEDILAIPDIPVPMYAKEISVPFPIGGLNQISLKSGSLAYQFSLPDERPVEVGLSIPDASLNGVPFEQSLSLQGSGVHQGTVDLEKYVLDLTDGSITFAYEAVYRDDQSPLDLSDFQYNMISLKHSLVDGHFGTIPISLGDDSTGIQVSSKLLDAGFRLESPRLGMIFHNSMGIPVEIHASELEVITQSSGSISLLTDSLANGILLDYPHMNQIGETKTSAAYLNENNSSLPEALSSNPIALDWNFGLTTHPSEDPNEQGFITDSSAFQIDLWVEVPLHGSMESYRFEQEFDIDMSELERVFDASIVLVTDNGIPLESYIQAYFLDASGMILDSLFETETPILASPTMNPDGSVESSAKAVVEVSLTEEKINTVLPAEQLKIALTLGTSGGGLTPVKFFPENSLGIKLGIKGVLDF